MAILLGLTAALCWGFADLFARFATHRIGTYRTLFFMQFFGFAGLSVYLFATGTLVKSGAQVGWQPWAVVATVINTGASLALYRSFEIGVLSVVSPIAASYGALTTILAILSGEHITVLHGVGILAALIGVILAAISREPALTTAADSATYRHTITRGAGWALAASLGYGVLFWLLGFKVIPQLGALPPVWLVRLGTIVLLLLFVTPTRQSLKVPCGWVWGYLAGVGILDTLAYVADTIGLGSGDVAIVTVLASLFSAVTVILAWILLRDKLQPSQWSGIVVILAGVLLVSLP